MTWQRILLSSAALIFFLHLSVLPAVSETVKIVVASFEAEGDELPPRIGHIVSEWLTTALVPHKGLEVIERRLIKEILEEQKLIETGLVGTDHFIKAGQLLGAEKIISGTVLQFAGNTEVCARVIALEKGKIFAAEKISVRDLALLEDEINILTDKLLQHLIRHD